METKNIQEWIVTEKDNNGRITYRQIFENFEEAMAIYQDKNNKPEKSIQIERINKKLLLES